MTETRTAPVILVVEDNKDLALGLRVNFEDAGYVAHVAHTLAAGASKLRQTQPDLVVLDLALPDGDGLDFLRRLRAGGEPVLVMVLTASAQQSAKVVGLRGGADDYVTKPFDLAELLARVEVLLRRHARGRPDAAGARAVAEHIAFGEVDIDTRARTVMRAGASVALSKIEYDLLLMLARSRGSVVSRAELMREVWGYGEGVMSRTLDTHIFELRRRLEPDPAAPKHIRTVWRIGYRLE